MATAVRRDVYVPYDETRAALSGFPDTPATLIADYAMHRFDHIIFDHEQWKTHWDATPVTASGQEEHPTPPIELYRSLNNPVRAGEPLAGITCTVTYIPEYVRKNGSIMAVTSRTLATVLGPKPKQGGYARVFDFQHNLTFLTSEEADGRETSCYFMMERNIATGTTNKRPSVATQMVTQGGWESPELRNFIAALFSRRVWKKEFLYGQKVYTFCKRKGQGNDSLVGGSFQDVTGLLILQANETCVFVEFGASASRKFPLQPLK